MMRSRRWRRLGLGLGSIGVVFTMVLAGGHVLGAAEGCLFDPEGPAQASTDCQPHMLAPFSAGQASDSLAGDRSVENTSVTIVPEGTIVSDRTISDS